MAPRLQVDLEAILDDQKSKCLLVRKEIKKKRINSADFEAWVVQKRNKRA